MTSEQGDLDDLGQMPSMSSKTREIGELQDMYRKTLAASWTCQLGELPADECIEDIFAGGDGWGKHKPSATAQTLSAKSTEDSTGDAESSGETRNKPGHHRRTSSGFGRHNNEKHHGHARSVSRTDKMNGANDRIRGISSPEHGHSSQSDQKRRSFKHMNEVDEFEALDDLRSWEISVKD